MIKCRMNKNHMKQFEKLDGFVVFSMDGRKLDGRKFGTYLMSIRPAKKKKNKK